MCNQTSRVLVKAKYTDRSSSAAEPTRDPPGHARGRGGEAPDDASSLKMSAPSSTKLARALEVLSRPATKLRWIKMDDRYP